MCAHMHCTHTPIHVHAHAHVYTHVRTHAHTCRLRCAHTQAHVKMCTHMHRIHTYTCTRTRMQTVHTRTRTDTHQQEEEAGGASLCSRLGHRGVGGLESLPQPDQPQSSSSEPSAARAQRGPRSHPGARGPCWLALGTVTAVTGARHPPGGRTVPEPAYLWGQAGACLAALHPGLTWPSPTPVTIPGYRVRFGARDLVPANEPQVPSCRARRRMDVGLSWPLCLGGGRCPGWRPPHAGPGCPVLRLVAEADAFRSPQQPPPASLASP